MSLGVRPPIPVSSVIAPVDFKNTGAIAFQSSELPSPFRMFLAAGTPEYKPLVSQFKPIVFRPALSWSSKPPSHHSSFSGKSKPSTSALKRTLPASKRAILSRLSFHSSVPCSKLVGLSVP